MNKSRFPRRGELCSPENACFTHILGGRTQFAPTKKQLIIVSPGGSSREAGEGERANTKKDII